MGRSGDGRSRLGQGLAGASVVTSIALEFTLPCVLGLAIDQRFRTSPAATLIGVVLGFVLGMLHTIRLGASDPSGGRDKVIGEAADPDNKPRPSEKTDSQEP